ncbi:glycosyltransferase family 2 protein [Halorussus sp. AFM4]|uniref:glycosyltransferase family 2 protein n=1 Tax=Halorussus sp. AFM4 TaxID=3421651 RepID=UPI003EC0F8C3
MPTVRPEVITTETIPSEPNVVVRRDEGLNVARNAGVRAAENDWIVIADDDIEFPTETVARTVAEMDERTLAGLADFPPCRWIIGRLMIFHRDLWRDVGGFDESRQHGGDTDFAIRVEKAGGDVVRLDREAVPHYDDDTGDGMSAAEHLEWIAYLTRRHPATFGPIGAKIIGDKATETLPV